MKEEPTASAAPSLSVDESVALVTEYKALWWVATADGGQLEQFPGDLVHWDGSDAIGETLHFVFEQAIFVGDETTFSYTPTASNPFRSKRLKRAHALPPPNSEGGYAYTLTVGGDPAEAPSNGADQRVEREADLRIRPRIRVRDVEVLPVPRKDAVQTVLSEEKGNVSKSNNVWLVKNPSNGHVAQVPGQNVRWPSHGSKKLRFRFDFDEAYFEGKEKSFQINLATKAEELVLMLKNLPQGDYCYGLEIEEQTGQWEPVWGPAVDDRPCLQDGSHPVYEGKQPPPGTIRPRIRVKDVRILPGD